MSADALDLDQWLAQRRESLPTCLHAVADQARLDAVLLASDYAFDQLRRHPELWPAIDAPPAALQLEAGEEAEWPARLRRFRHHHSLALLADEVMGAPLESTLARSSWLAEHCLQQAHNAVFRQLCERHGRPRNGNGDAQSLVVMALGKLGGGELNFSSDIDLVFAYPQAGHSDGERALDNESFFQRLGQRLIQLLGEVTAEGFGFRVDMRLRPFGNAGRLVLSFAAMEQYYQRDGRDWERYAWIKARPVAGDIDAGAELLDLLRPFVFRRYLDYTAFDGLREMKALIEAEVQRRDLADHLKLGPGGIREVEFIVQLQQLIRGGKSAPLRRSGLLAALAELEMQGYLRPSEAARLRAAYRFLRQLENRVQMLRDEQVHSLPEDPLLRARLARGLGYVDWDALQQALQIHRQHVREEFTRVFEAREQRSVATQVQPLREYWRQIERAASAEQLAAAGLAEAAQIHPLLHTFAAGLTHYQASAAARQRLDRLMPDLLFAAAKQVDPLKAVQRLLALLQAIVRRPSYLALLDEQPAALQRLVDVLGRSSLLAERIIAHPILLDDLLDGRADTLPPDRERLRQRVDSVLGRQAGDLEQALLDLNEIRQSVGFRIGLAALFQRQPAARIAEALAELAEVLVAAVLQLALRDLQSAHGCLSEDADDAGLAVIGYGSLGGRELGFSSDLDLVFLFDSDLQQHSSSGPRVIDGGRYQLRLVQKMLALLSTLTAAGRLYEVDLRLRPDGAKGLLLVSLSSFAEYQQQRAWTWEHQALVRARPVAGSRSLALRFEAVRRQQLGRSRLADDVLRDVARMRQRMRHELDRGNAQRFDLKQGTGGLVDIEFMLQAIVLIAAAEHPDLLTDTRNGQLLQAAVAAMPNLAGALQPLAEAHNWLLQRSLECGLDQRPRLHVASPQLEQVRAQVLAAWQALGLGAAEAEPAKGPGKAAAAE